MTILVIAGIALLVVIAMAAKKNQHFKDEYRQALQSGKTWTDYV